MPNVTAFAGFFRFYRQIAFQTSRKKVNLLKFKAIIPNLSTYHLDLSTISPMLEAKIVTDGMQLANWRIPNVTQRIPNVTFCCPAVDNFVPTRVK
jgi:hypothetical protein